LKFLNYSESTLFLEDIEEPVPKKGQMLVRIEGCGICGSDIGNVFGNSCKPTSKLGHEVVGILEKFDSDANPASFTIGERVFVHHHAPCNECYFCTKGNETMCEKFTDSLYPCGISEKIVIPEWIVKSDSIFRLPESISPEEGIMIEPLACCIRGWKKVNLLEGDTILIFGIGPIGMINAMLAKIKGARKIFCVDINDYRLTYNDRLNLGKSFNSKKVKIANNLPTSSEEFVDMVIVATSDLSVLNDSIKIIRKGGIILIFGEPQMEMKMDLNIDEIYSKEISIITTYAASNKEIMEAIELIDKKIINLKKIVTHKFLIKHSKEAIERIFRKKDTLKTMIINPDK